MKCEQKGLVSVEVETLRIEYDLQGPLLPDERILEARVKIGSLST